jgi:hypothetical protein
VSILDDDSTYVDDDGDTAGDADLCSWCECRRDRHEDGVGPCESCEGCKRFVE